MRRDCVQCHVGEGQGEGVESVQGPVLDWWNLVMGDPSGGLAVCGAISRG